MGSRSRVLASSWPPPSSGHVHAGSRVCGFRLGSAWVRTLPRVGCCTGRCVRGAVCLTLLPLGLLKDAAPSFRGDSSASTARPARVYVWAGYWRGSWAQGRRWRGARLRPPRGSDAAAGAAEPAAGRVGWGWRVLQGLFGAERVASENVRPRGHLGSSLLVTRWFGILSGMRMGVSCVCPGPSTGGGEYVKPASLPGHWTGGSS